MVGPRAVASVTGSAGARNRRQSSRRRQPGPGGTFTQEFEQSERRVDVDASGEGVIRLRRPAENGGKQNHLVCPFQRILAHCRIGKIADDRFDAGAFGMGKRQPIERSRVRWLGRRRGSLQLASLQILPPRSPRLSFLSDPRYWLVVRSTIGDGRCVNKPVERGDILGRDPPLNR